MKLSEAMMLGDVLRIRTNKLYLCVLNTKIGNDASLAGVDPSTPDGTVCGCAIGGAYYAATGETSYRRGYWPWLLEPSSRPHLDWEGLIGCGVQLYDGITSFGMVLRGEATFEQLVDYVRSIEPACGECNRFECTCEQNPEVIPAAQAVTA